MDDEDGVEEVDGDDDIEGMGEGCWRRRCSNTCTAARMAACKPPEEPLVKNQVLFAPKAAAAKFCASRNGPSEASTLPNAGNSGKSN